jgi:hypothetical protein
MLAIRRTGRALWTSYRGRTGARRGSLTALAVILGLGWSLMTPGYAMTIDVVDGSGVTTDMQTAINEVVGAYDTAFANPITLTIGLQGASCGSCVADSLTQTGSVAYGSAASSGSWYSAMSNYAASGLSNPTFNTAFASLPTNQTAASSALGGTNGNVTVTAANLTALGYSVSLGTQNFATATGFDGVISVNSALSVGIPSHGTIPGGTYDLVSALEHELDEVMGIGSALNAGHGYPNTPFAEDYFRYSAPGTRSWNPSSSIKAYFSIDGGTTDLANFNQNPSGDYNDWATANGGCSGAGNPLPQDAFAASGQVPLLMCNSSTPDPELMALDALGYDLANTAPLLALDASQEAQTVPEPASIALLAPALLGLLRLRRRVV